MSVVKSMEVVKVCFVEERITPAVCRTFSTGLADS